MEGPSIPPLVGRHAAAGRLGRFLDPTPFFRSHRPNAAVSIECWAATERTAGRRLDTGSVPPVPPPLDRRIFHIATPADADRLAADGTLSPPSLAAEGFVHCSTGTQVLATTERWFAPDADLVLLELDPDRLDADVDWPEVYPGQHFPHVLGPLNASAVIARHPWDPEARRQWPRPWSARHFPQPR